MLPTSKVVHEVCEALWETLHPSYLPMVTESLWRNIAQQFYTRCNFPNYIFPNIVVLNNYLQKSMSSDAIYDRYSSPQLLDREGNDGMPYLGGQWRTKSGTAVQSLVPQGNKKFAAAAGFIRHAYANYLVSRAGEAPWQRHVVNRGHLYIDSTY